MSHTCLVKSSNALAGGHARAGQNHRGLRLHKRWPPRHVGLGPNDVHFAIDINIQIGLVYDFFLHGQDGKIGKDTD